MPFAALASGGNSFSSGSNEWNRFRQNFRGVSADESEWFTVASSRLTDFAAVGVRNTHRERFIPSGNCELDTVSFTGSPCTASTSLLARRAQALTVRSGEAGTLRSLDFPGDGLTVWAAASEVEQATNRHHRISLKSMIRPPSLPPVAIRPAADTARRIAGAHFATSFDVAGVGPELCAVERLEEASSAHLARDGGQRVLRGRGTR